MLPPAMASSEPTPIQRSLRLLLACAASARALVLARLPDGGTKGGNIGEFIGVIETDGQSLAAPHRQTGNGAVVGVFLHPIFLFNHGHDVLKQVFFDGRSRPLAAVGSFPEVADGVTKRHGDQRRHGLSLRKQVVHDEIGLADARPHAFVVARAVVEVEHRVRLIRRRRIARGRVKRGSGASSSGLALL